MEAIWRGKTSRMPLLSCRFYSLHRKEGYKMKRSLGKKRLFWIAVALIEHDLVRHDGTSGASHPDHRHRGGQGRKCLPRHGCGRGGGEPEQQDRAGHEPRIGRFRRGYPAGGDQPGPDRHVERSLRGLLAAQEGALSTAIPGPRTRCEGWGPMATPRSRWRC